MNLALKDYYFGWADADTEAKRNPEVFDNVFYDRNNMLNEVLDGYSFLVMGRKGSGKSALGAKIQLMSNKDCNLIVKKQHLSNFEFKTFGKISRSDLSGGARYAGAWSMVLMLELFSTINNIPGINDINCISAITKRLKTYGLLPNGEFSKVIRVASKSGFKIPLPFDSGIEGEKSLEKELSDPSEIADILLTTIRTLFLEPYKIRIIIDGLDDVLRGKEQQLEVVSGLIRTANSLNNTFLEYNLPIKFIVLARIDIVTACNDPDINKIKRDSSITIDWVQDTKNPLEMDLMKMVQLRFQGSSNTELTKGYWYKVFPEQVHYKDSWHAILDNTLFRPRDILQFLRECQNLFGNATRISFSQVKQALASYSENYFIDEMKNELAGFLPEPIITVLPSRLSQLENVQFNYSHFRSIFADECERFGQDPKRLIEVLFENGYLGQLRRRDEGQRTFLVFRYRDKHECINYSDQFRMHNGLWKALNLK